MKTGFKATYNFYCKDHKFEIGQTYKLQGTPIPCHYGFHYCENPINVLNYYSIKHDFRLLEIEDLGDSIVKEDKTVTNKIRIIREIPKEEYYSLFGIVNNQLKITYENGSWEKGTFDANNNCIRFEDSDGYWKKRTFDENHNCIYSENSIGYWEKYKYDERNNCVYYENSDG